MILGRALFDSIWIGAAGTAVVWLVLGRTRKMSAAARYSMWCMLLAGIALVPCATVAGSMVRAAFSVVVPYDVSREANPLPRRPQSGIVDRIGNSSAGAVDLLGSRPPEKAAASDVSPRFVGVLLAVWLGGATLFLARLFRALLAVRRIKRAAVAIPCEFALPRGAALLCATSEEAGPPCALGYARAAILVPRYFMRDLSAASRHDVLLHEAAHLRRYDDCTALFARACAAILWFNPAVHVAAGRMNAEREIACDDAVVASTNEPRRYARTLWNLAQLESGPTNALAAGVASKESSVVLRLARLLGPRPPEARALSRLGRAFAAAAAGLAVASAGYLAPASAWPRSGVLVPTGAMSSVRAHHTSTLLPDGDVLIAGGLTGNTPASALSSAELYDPKTRAFRATGDMHVARCGATATLLRDGTVLIAGGWTPGGVTAEAELYRADTGVFTRIASMHVRRADHTATLLQDGRVLLAGGVVDNLVATRSAEIFDPATQRFAQVASLRDARAAHVAALLFDGRVLVAGGADGRTDLASAELFDPSSERFGSVAAMTAPRSKLAAVTMNDGRVLLAGGQTDGARGGPVATAELYDPQAKTFAPTGDMHDARFKINEAAVRLRNGDVLVAGGAGRAEIYDETSGRFTVAGGSLGTVRHYGAATVLADGSVLVTGGYSLPPDGPPAFTASAVLYVR